MHRAESVRELSSSRFFQKDLATNLYSELELLMLLNKHKVLLSSWNRPLLPSVLYFDLLIHCIDQSAALRKSPFSFIHFQQWLHMHTENSKGLI